MTRIVEHEATGPAVIRKDAIVGQAIHVCRCGLTSTPPLCDGSHRMTRGESPHVLVRYVRTDEGLVARPVEVRDAAEPERVAVLREQRVASPKI